MLLCEGFRAYPPTLGGRRPPRHHKNRRVSSDLSVRRWRGGNKQSVRGVLRARTSQGVFGFNHFTMWGGCGSPGRGVPCVPAFIQQPAPPALTSDRIALGVRSPKAVFGLDFAVHMAEC